MTDFSQLIDDYLYEAQQHLQAMNRALLVLEKQPQDKTAMQHMMHAAHTLKSMSATMGYDDTARLCHAIEDIVVGVRDGTLDMHVCVDTLFAALDELGAGFALLKAGSAFPDVSSMVARVRGLMHQDPLLTPDNEQHSVMPSDADMQSGAPEAERVSRIDVKVEKLDAMMTLAEELFITKLKLDQIKSAIDHPEMNITMQTLGRQITEMQYNIMQSRLVPVSFVFDRFPRMLRDLAKSEQKEVTLDIEGGDIELDRLIVEGLGDPLVHLLRNAVDHGLETTQERQQQGKPAQGTIRLHAQRAKNIAKIEIRDDGRGLDVDKIRSLATQRGLITQDATREEVMYSLFSGLTTTTHVTAVSGRGLGLNIVKEKIEALGGTVAMSSELGHGTCFTIELPLTLAILKALFVNVQGTIFAIPVANVKRLVTVKRETTKGFFDMEAVVLGGADIPITHLGELFHLPATNTPIPGADDELQPIVIVRRDEEDLGLAVDALMGTEEIIIKPLHKMVRQHRYVAGAGIMGSGDVVLIVDVPGLIMSRGGKHGSTSDQPQGGRQRGRGTHQIGKDARKGAPQAHG